MEYLLVGLGGAAGSITRYSLGKYLARHSKSSLPLNTFLINISGAFLLGLLTSSYTYGSSYLLLGEGFLGAYTTFSTFMYEGFVLFKDRRYLNAILYIFLSFLLGVLGFILGYRI